MNVRKVTVNSSGEVLKVMSPTEVPFNQKHNFHVVLSFGGKKLVLDERRLSRGVLEKLPAAHGKATDQEWKTFVQQTFSSHDWK